MSPSFPRLSDLTRDVKNQNYPLQTIYHLDPHLSMMLDFIRISGYYYVEGQDNGFVLIAERGSVCGRDPYTFRYFHNRNDRHYSYKEAGTWFEEP